MRRRLLSLLVLPLALALSGCFQVFSTLTVRADGSAQIVERVTAEGAMAMALMSMTEEMSGTSSFERRAAAMGDGVTLASVEEAFEPGQITYTVTYDVADVNQLAYTVSNAVDPESMGESILGGGMSMEDEEIEIEEMEDEEIEIEEMEDDGETFDAPMVDDGEMAEDDWDDADAGDEDGDEPYRFAFTPATGGQPASLRVIVPGSAVEDFTDFDTSQLDGGDDPEDNYKSSIVLLGTMSMQFDVVVEGADVEAERGWADGNRVTVSAIQMGDLLTYTRDNLSDVDALMADRDPETDIDLPGLRVAAPGIFAIRFR